MDLQDLLCGMTAEKLRVVDLQMPNLERFRELRRSLSHRSRRAFPGVGVLGEGSKGAPLRGRTTSGGANAPGGGGGVVGGGKPRVPACARAVTKVRRAAAAGRRAAAGKGARGPRRRHLPVATGKHTVGCVDLMSDHTIDGTFLRLYYPTETRDVMKRECQWPLWLPRKQYGQGYVYFRRKNTRVFGTIMNWVGGDVYVPVLWQAPLLEGSQTFPVVIFTHGLGGNRTTYTTLCCDLASHGYIVAALEHRDGSASMTYCLKESSANEDSAIEVSPSSDSDDWDSEETATGLKKDQGLEEHWLWYERQEKEDDFHVRNKQVHKRVEELQRALDLLEFINSGKPVKNVLGLHFDLKQLKGRMDLGRVAIVGHSFGGATCIAALAAEKRFVCGVALDSWMLPLEAELYDKVKQPVLMVNTETFQWKQNVKDMFKLKVNGARKKDRVLITIKGTCHQSQTDFQFMLPSKVARFLELRHTLSPKVAMEINSKASRGFLAKHLNIPDHDHHDDIMEGRHPHVFYGTDYGALLDRPPK